MALIRCLKRFKTTDLYYVLLIKDEAEIDTWIRNMDPQQLEFFGKTQSFMDLDCIDHKLLHFPTYEREDRVKFVDKSHKHASVFNSHTDLDGTRDFTRTEEYRSCILEEKSINNSQAQSNSSVSKSRSASYNGKNIILKSHIILSRFRLILFFSILAVTATNIAIAIYIADAVSHSREINTFSDLGNILYDVSHIAESSREIDYNVRFNFSSVENSALEIESTLDELYRSNKVALKNLHK